MAVKKTASPSKSDANANDAPAPKGKAGGAKGEATGAAAASKTSSSRGNSAAPKTAGPKKAAPAPVKLSPTQSELLKAIGGSGETGYLSQKKNEQRTIDALRERKLIKRGAKNKESGDFSYQVSAAGKKFLDTPAPAPSAGSSGSSAGGNG